MPLNPPIPDWTGRVVWLVGASSGIGRACAERLAERGARVVVSARRVEALQDFTRRHRDSLSLPLDVTEPGVLQGAVEAIRARWGRIDLVVYCAGHYRAQRATDFDLAEMLRHQQINWTGALHLLAAVLPLLQAQGGGHLSLVASVAGYRALPRALAYGPTKTALQQLAEGLHLDLRPLGIGVSVVNPGFVETPLTAQNDFRMPALISPLAAADAMLAGWARGDYEIHFPKRFTRVLKLLRLLPPALYLPLIRRLTAPAR